MMQLLVRALAHAFMLCASAAIAQEVTGARAVPSEISIGDTAGIVVDFRSVQSTNDNSNPYWSCGLDINYGDGKSEFHRVENKQAPYRLMHKYEAPGNYAVTLEGKTQFKGFNTVFSCGGETRSVAIVVRPKNFAALEAAERAAKEKSLKRATADRIAAQRAAEKAKEERALAEGAAKKSAADRTNAERQQRAPTPQAVDAAPKSAERSAPEKKAAAEPKQASPSGVKARSAMDL